MFLCSQTNTKMPSFLYIFRSNSRPQDYFRFPIYPILVSGQVLICMQSRSEIIYGPFLSERNDCQLSFVIEEGFDRKEDRNRFLRFISVFSPPFKKAKITKKWKAVLFKDKFHRKDYQALFKRKEKRRKKITKKYVETKRVLIPVCSFVY